VEQSSYSKAMQPRQLKTGDVIQLHPTECRNPMFGGCMMVVTNPKEWGAQGYVQALGEDMRIGSQAYYIAMWEEMEWVGEAMWVVG